MTQSVWDATTLPEFSKVEPKNYDFTFDKFKVFYPGKTLKQIKKSYPAIELINDEGSFKTYKVDVIHVRYKFPVFIQISNDAVVDFYARLPSYFIHDIFHQSIINRFGKQNKFINKDGTSIYIWNNADGLKMTYSGACTITCFPIFIHGISSTDKNNLKNNMMIKMLNTNK